MRICEGFRKLIFEVQLWSRAQLRFAKENLVEDTFKNVWKLLKSPLKFDDLQEFSELLVYEDLRLQINRKREKERGGSLQVRRFM